MMFILSRKVAITAVSTIAALMSVGLSAAPEITDIQLDGDIPVVESSIIVIGNKFGLKTQEVPVLYDTTTNALQNGQLNDYQVNFVDGQKIQRESEDANSLWTKSSNDSGEANYPVVNSKMMRHTAVHKNYLLEGGNSFLGWPAAYGGGETPDGNDKLYMSWWYKLKYNPSMYWQWKLENIKGNFIESSDSSKFGETIDVGPDFTAKVIGYKNGFLNLVFDKPLEPNKVLSAANLQGQIIRGLSSGATATLATGSQGSTGAYLSPGSNKFIRVWEEGSGKDGFRLSWTQMHLTVTKSDNTSFVNWASFEWETDKWMHFEVSLDLNKFVEIKVNNEVLHDVDFVAIGGVAKNDGDYSPTAALLGFNGDNQPFQSSEVSEIYMDKSLQRVAIADSSSWANVSHYEIQYVESWKDNVVIFKYNPGAFQSSNNLYLYVFDSEGNVNEQGKKLCKACVSQPVAPSLNVD